MNVVCGYCRDKMSERTTMRMFRNLHFKWVYSFSYPRAHAHAQHNIKTPHIFRASKMQNCTNSLTHSKVTLKTQFRYIVSTCIVSPPLIAAGKPLSSQVFAAGGALKMRPGLGGTRHPVRVVVPIENAPSEVTYRLKLPTRRRYTATWIQKPPRGPLETWDQTWACRWMTKSGAKLMSASRIWCDISSVFLCSVCDCK